MKVSDIRKHFIDELAAKRFTVDRLGSKTIEMVGASFLADEPAIFGEVNQEYVDAEIKWYLSESTNIQHLADLYDTPRPPVAWQITANHYGEVNSNYGHLIFSPKYHNQFNNCLEELLRNPDTRRAQMIYTRPSIWSEYDENGKNDFICTNAQTCYIRDNKLHMVCQMRSNDAIYGYKNDSAWARYLMKRLVKSYNQSVDVDQTFGPLLEVGDLYWQVMNLHCYERHFDLVK